MEAGGGNGRWQVCGLEAHGTAITPEDVWNAAIREGADPERMALSLYLLLGEVTPAAADAGAEDDHALVRFTLKTGEQVQYDATPTNPFRGGTRL